MSQEKQPQQPPKEVDLTFNEAKQLFGTFVRERNWQKFHTPRNLVLALMGEVGELAQIFQWKGQLQKGLPQFSEQERVHLGEEVADVMSYLFRLGDVCGIDISKAVLDKVEKNKKKYPAEKIDGTIDMIEQYQTMKRKRVKKE